MLPLGLVQMAGDKDTRLSELKEKVAKFRDERNWRQFHNPKNLAMSIAVEAAELMELFQWRSLKESEKMKEDKKAYQKVCGELADVVIYCLSLAEAVGIDISVAVEEKLAANGKKYPKEKFSKALQSDSDIRCAKRK